LLCELITKHLAEVIGGRIDVDAILRGGIRIQGCGSTGVLLLLLLLLLGL
jgi:hypothetical protein